MWNNCSFGVIILLTFRVQVGLGFRVCSGFVVEGSPMGRFVARTSDQSSFSEPALHNDNRAVGGPPIQS